MIGWKLLLRPLLWLTTLVKEGKQTDDWLQVVAMTTLMVHDSLRECFYGFLCIIKKLQLTVYR